jgi:diazepam-binding inhibitor (GABA receptor modulating acyl-CoA-binding protein)
MTLTFEQAKIEDRKYQFYLSDAEKLTAKVLLKQVTFGDVNTPRPLFWKHSARKEWEEWNKLKGMSKEKAQEEYVKYIAFLNVKYVAK